MHERPNGINNHVPLSRAPHTRHASPHRDHTAKPAGDYVVFLTPASVINRDGCGEKKRRFLRVALSEGPVNLGADGKNLITGGDPDQMIAAVTDESSVAATFSDSDAVRRLVGRLKRESRWESR